jgi:hypothetical protein
LPIRSVAAAFKSTAATTDALKMPLCTCTNKPTEQCLETYQLWC